MKFMMMAFAACLFHIMSPSLFAQNRPEPLLTAAQLPMYPPTAPAGIVKASFVLNTKGEVISVEILSVGSYDLRKATEENIWSWKFQMPHDLYRTEWKYETTFVYHLSGHEVENKQTPKFTVIFESFRHVEVIRDNPRPVVLVD
jgi:hypothetical protein